MLCVFFYAPDSFTRDSVSADFVSFKSVENPIHMLYEYCSVCSPFDQQGLKFYENDKQCVVMKPLEGYFSSQAGSTPMSKVVRTVIVWKVGQRQADCEANKFSLLQHYRLSDNLRQCTQVVQEQKKACAAYNRHKQNTEQSTLLYQVLTVMLPLRIIPFIFWKVYLFFTQ